MTFADSGSYTQKHMFSIDWVVRYVVIPNKYSRINYQDDLWNILVDGCRTTVQTKTSVHHPYRCQCSPKILAYERLVR